MAGQQLEHNQAILFLEQRWAQTGLGGIHPDHGDGADPAGGEAPPERPGRGAHQQPDRDAPQEPHPAQPPPPAGLQPIAFDPDARIATTLAARPADYAIKRIEARKHVPLWYFTREGLREAACTIRQSDDNDTLAVTKSEEGQVSVRSAGSLTASKNVKFDHHLPYAEFMYAKNLFLMAINNVKWGEETVDLFNWFFHNLDNHSI